LFLGLNKRGVPQFKRVIELDLSRVTDVKPFANALKALVGQRIFVFSKGQLRLLSAEKMAPVRKQPAVL
jgi:hypothetical protein